MLPARAYLTHEQMIARASVLLQPRKRIAGSFAGAVLDRRVHVSKLAKKSRTRQDAKWMVHIDWSTQQPIIGCQRFLSDDEPSM